MADNADTKPVVAEAPAAAAAATTAGSPDGDKEAKANKSRRAREKKQAKKAAASADAAEEAAPAAAAAAAAEEVEEDGDERSRTPKCRECQQAAEDLYRDRKDGKLYCAGCWKKWYRRAPPASARFKAGPAGAKGSASKSKKGAAAEEEEVGQPIAPEEVEVDHFYEAVLREGAPSVFVGKDKVAWSVMLKGASDRFAYALLQLVTHDDCIVVFSRTGRVNEGADNATETYYEFPKIGEAKDKFCDVFFEFTKNKFVDVKRCVTKFVTRGDYTLTADVKAARRAENDQNRVAREAKEKQLIDERNAQIVAAVKSELGAAGAAGAAVKANDQGLSAPPAVRNEDRRRSPKPAALEQPSADADDRGASPVEEGEMSPAEPPCTPAVAPREAAQAVSPRPTAATPKAAPAKPPIRMATPPASPRPTPAPAPAKPSSTSTKPAASAPAAAAAAPAKKKMIIDEAPPSSNGTIAIVAGVVAVAAVAGFVLMRKK